VKAESGAKRVVVFDHTLRTADDAAREARKIREVVTRVHNDYTEWSARSACATCCPTRPTTCCASASRSFKYGGRSAMPWRLFRSPSAMPARYRPRTSSSWSGVIRTASGRPTRSPTVPTTSGIGSHTCSARRHWYSRPTSRSRMAARAGLPFPRPDRGARCAAAREHRNPHARFFLKDCGPSCNEQRCSLWPD
jgi:hypothetical protein